MLLANRAAMLDQTALAQNMEEKGWHILPRLLGRDECAALRSAYGDDARYRSTVVMQRHGFGRGEYRYFRHPLPDPIAALRAAFYPPPCSRTNGPRSWVSRRHIRPSMPLFLPNVPWRGSRGRRL